MNALPTASVPATPIQGTSRKISKLCARIMLLFLVFTTPFLIINFIKNKRYSYLEKDGKSLMEFIHRLSTAFAYANCFSNAVLFLTSTVKARQFLTEATGFQPQINNTVNLVQSSSSYTATQPHNVKFEHLGETSKKEDSSTYLQKFTLKERAGYASSDIQSDVVKNAMQST